MLSDVKQRGKRKNDFLFVTDPQNGTPGQFEIFEVKFDVIIVVEKIGKYFRVLASSTSTYMPKLRKIG